MLSSRALITYILLMLPFSSMAKSVVLGAMEYPPYYGRGLKNFGPLIEIVVESYRHSGYEVEIVFLPFARAMYLSKAGEIDGVVGAWYSQERSESLLYSMPMIDNKVGFFKRKGEDITYKDFNDLKQQGYRLGSVNGYMLPAGLLESGITIYNVSREDQLLKILRGKRVDLVVLDQGAARYALKQPRLSGVENKVEWMEPTLERNPQYLVISKKAARAAEKLKAFNQGYKFLTESGEVRKILSDHGLSPQKFQ